MSEDLRKRALYNVRELLELVQLTEEEIEREDYDCAQSGLIDIGVYLARLDKNLEDFMP